MIVRSTELSGMPAMNSTQSDWCNSFTGRQSDKDFWLGVRVINNSITEVLLFVSCSVVSYDGYQHLPLCLGVRVEEHDAMTRCVLV